MCQAACVPKASPTTNPWPSWRFYPSNVRAAAWTQELLEAVSSVREKIDTERDSTARGSDAVLAALRPGLEAMGFDVERNKTAQGKVVRPVLFGDNGVASSVYEVDAAHDGHGIVMEVEAGRGARGNAAFRDIIRTSLILDARYLVLLQPLVYRVNTQARVVNVRAYHDTREVLNAIYASARLRLPFEGLLLVGY